MLIRNTIGIRTSRSRRRTSCVTPLGVRRARLQLERLEDRTVPSGTPTLVKDINTLGFSSNPDHEANVNGTLFFSANDGTHCVEVWKSDGPSLWTSLVKY